MSKKLRFLIYTILIAVLFMLLCIEGIDIVRHVLFPHHGTWIGNLQLYMWAGIGALFFMVGQRFLKENLKWFETFTHELIHTLVSILLFRRIHSFEAKNGNGMMLSSGSDKTLVFVDLAPYCLPIYTYVLLFIRSITTGQFLWCIDTMIGISLAFHISCFKKQIGSYQSDINKRPLYFSYTYIATALLFNACVFLVSFWNTKNVFTALWYVIKGLFKFQNLWQ